MITSVATAFKETFAGWKPLFSAALVGGVVYAFMAYLPVREVVGIVLSDPSISFPEKIDFLQTTLVSPLPSGTSFTLFSIFLSLLFGINISLLAHYLTKRREALLASNIALSAGALVSGLLGIGCLSCGSLIAAFIASFAGGGSSLFASVLTNGWWLMGISTALLAISIILTAKKITEPMVCEPEYRTSEKRPVIVFDGVCSLCNRAVDFIITHDTKNMFYFADRDGEVAKKLKAEAGLPHDITEKTMLFFKDGTYYSKSRAVLEIAKHLGFPYSLLYLSIIVPYPVRDFFYDFVSRRRATLFGAGETHTCRIMTPELESKFL